MRKREKEETESIKTPQHTSAHVSTRHRHVESGGPGGAVRVRIASPLESRLSGSASAADAPGNIAMLATQCRVQSKATHHECHGRGSVLAASDPESCAGIRQFEDPSKHAANKGLNSELRFAQS